MLRRQPEDKLKSVKMVVRWSGMFSNVTYMIENIVFHKKTITKSEFLAKPGYFPRREGRRR